MLVFVNVRGFSIKVLKSLESHDSVVNRGTIITIVALSFETLALSSSILLSILEIADTEKLTLLPQTIFLRKS